MGTSKPLVVTSGVALLSLGRLSTEDDSVPSSSQVPRAHSEEAAKSVASKGVDVYIVRLSPSVHSVEDRSGFIPISIAKAKEKQQSVYVGEGKNQWPAVHCLDAAEL